MRTSTDTSCGANQKLLRAGGGEVFQGVVRPDESAVVQGFGGDPSVIEPLTNISEDCLFLNIWTFQVATPLFEAVHHGCDATPEKVELLSTNLTIYV